MSLSQDFFQLPNGSKIPAIAYGMGTKWEKRGEPGLNDNLIKNLQFAIDVGFRHFDGAEVYNTNKEIGLLLNKSSLSRDQLFITDKFFSGGPDLGERSDYKDPYSALKGDLRDLQLDYVDLYLLHSPHIKKETHGYSLIEAWQCLERLKDEGLAKNIGVSNFSVDDLRQISENNPTHRPAVNQIEYSASVQDQPPGIFEYCKQQGILIEGYGVLSPLLETTTKHNLNSLLTKLSKKYGKTEAQILLRWTIQQGVLPVVTSNDAADIKSFLEIFDFQLTMEDLDAISGKGSDRGLKGMLHNVVSKVKS